MAEMMSEAQFRKFMKRIEDCFDRADKQVEQLHNSTIQRFDTLEKRIDEGFCQSQKADIQGMDQGFDKLMQTMDKLQFLAISDNLLPFYAPCCVRLVSRLDTAGAYLLSIRRFVP